MRNCFARLMTEYAPERKDLVLLYADIGNRLFNKLKEIAPERAINAGIAESNMATVAAGMAMSGFRPFIYTITPFTTSRNFEQIKIDIAYQNQPVTIVGTGSGMAYANLGPTHHSFEDISLMRVLPNMTVLCPADTQEMEVLFEQIIEMDGPVYFRLGKKNEPVVHEKKPELKIGEFYRLKEGKKVALLSTGTMLPNVMSAAEQLENMGISVEIISAHTVKPLDKEYLRSAASKFELIVTIEEHSLNGGFGSAVSEYLADSSISCCLLRLGLPDLFMDKMHSQETARERAGLSADGIVQSVKSRLEE